MKKTFSVLLMVLLSVMLIVSCSDSTEAEAEAKIEYDDIIGVWRQGTDSDYIKITFTAEKKATMNEKTAS